MKKHLLIFMFLGVGLIYSCRKKDDIVLHLDTLQHKWTYDSIVVYENPTFVGLGYKIPGYQGYSDFRTDGKVYSLKSILYNGIPISVYDTANYILKDNNTLITFQIENNMAATKADTIMINTLNDKILVLENVTQDIDGTYGKLFLHK